MIIFPIRKTRIGHFWFWGIFDVFYSICIKAWNKVVRMSSIKEYETNSRYDYNVYENWLSCDEFSFI